MKHTARLLAAALLLPALLLPAALLAAQSNTVKLAGTYRWSGEEGRLEAVFTPTGKNTWECSFSAVFSGDTVTYKGTAEGNLSRAKEGSTLYAKVRTSNRQRTFTVRALFENGAFRGTHSEVFRSGERRTGTLVLQPD